MTSRMVCKGLNPLILFLFSLHFSPSKGSRCINTLTLFLFTPCSSESWGAYLDFLRCIKVSAQRSLSLSLTHTNTHTHTIICCYTPYNSIYKSETKLLFAQAYLKGKWCYLVINCKNYKFDLFPTGKTTNNQKCMIIWCHGFAIKKCRYNGSQWGKNSHEQ